MRYEETIRHRTCLILLPGLSPMLCTPATNKLVLNYRTEKTVDFLAYQIRYYGTAGKHPSKSEERGPRDTCDENNRLF
jgi:hypothetical protein